MAVDAPSLPARRGGDLGPPELALLGRQLRRKRLPLALCAISLATAAAFLGYHLIRGTLDGPRVVIVLLLTIGAKNHLRVFRLTVLLEKLNRLREGA